MCWACEQEQLWAAYERYMAAKQEAIAGRRGGDQVRAEATEAAEPAPIIAAGEPDRA